MIVLGILVSIAAIGTMCWLLFNLAVFALPLFIGLNAGTWAYGTGAGWLGAILIGLVAAGLTLAVGQGLLMLVRPIWARILIALAFVAPAGVAGFLSTVGFYRQTHDAVRNLADHLFGDWRGRCGRDGVFACCWHGDRRPC